MIEQSGGRAGPNEFYFVNAGYKLDEIEPLRQQLLSQNDVGKVQKVIRKLGLRVKRGIIQAVKSYNFDSQGLGFTYENYAAWRRLVTGNGTIGDVAYIVHEIAEVEELQRIQRESGFDFMKKNFSNPKEFKQWNNDFNRYYRQAHSKALEAEYQFVAQQIIEITNNAVTISLLQAAAIDPTRYVSLRTNETEAARHLIVDGIIMREHKHYNSWRRRADEVVSLGKSIQRRLAYYRKQITLEELIRLVKNRPIK